MLPLSTAPPQPQHIQILKIRQTFPQHSSPTRPNREEDDEDYDSPILYQTHQKFESKELYRMILYNKLDFDRAPFGTDELSAEARDFLMTLLER